MTRIADQSADLVAAQFRMLLAEIHNSLLRLLPDRPWNTGPVTIRRAIQTEEPARLPLTALPVGHGLTRQIPAMRRAHSFFSSASLRILFPSIASAYIFLSSAFSFSRAFRRLASASSI